MNAKPILKTNYCNKGGKATELYIVLGFISAFLGGILGIIAGYIYSQSKQRTSSGEMHYVYDKKTRDTGRIMMIIGIFAFLIGLIWSLS